MLLSSPTSAQKFSPAIASGLRSLLVPPSGGVVVTRAIAAASRECGGAGVQESRDGPSIIGNNAKNAKAEEDVMIKSEEDEEDGGCWVSYGRREPRRRLPPPLPSLLARGALRRTRTEDGRVVIRIAPVVWAECLRARRRGGRLAMQLVEHDDESPMTLPAPTGAREDDVVRALDEPQDDTAAPAVIGEGTAAAATDFGSECIDDVEGAAVAAQEMLPVVPPPRVPSAGCFEDVIKYSSIGGSSLHQMPSLRMVH